jgi:hypothetical protein
MTVDKLIKALRAVKKKYPKTGGKLRIELHHPMDLDNGKTRLSVPADTKFFGVATYQEDEEYAEEKVVVIK